MKQYQSIFYLLILICVNSCVSTQDIITKPTILITPRSKDVEDNNPSVFADPTPIQTKKFDTITIQPNKSVGYTHIRPDGNRFIAGTGQFPELTSMDIPLPGLAIWVVSIPWEGGSFWTVTLEDGQVLGVQVNSEGWEFVDFNFANLKPYQPPILTQEFELPTLLIAPPNLASPFTNPVPIHHTNFSQAFIDIQENIVLVNHDSNNLSQINTNALPDARLMQDESGRLLFLSKPTLEYNHSVLGDAIEAKSITRIDDPVTGKVSATITAPDGMVIEGIAPIWTDINGDGVREIVVTISNAQIGAQIFVYNEDGKQIAIGPAIGRGYRWLHQIAVAPLGINGESELVTVRTPHLGGVVEFYQWIEDQLVIVAQLSGYTSHIIGSRNLDMAAVGDFDGDGRIELMLPTQERSELAAIRRKNTGAEEAWSIPLGAKMITNLGAVTLSDGSISIGIGLDNGILRIWHP